jgi:hypothetical protein
MGEVDDGDMNSSYSSDSSENDVMLPAPTA